MREGKLVKQSQIKIVNAPLRETVVMKAGRSGIVEAQMDLSIHEYRVFFKMLTMVDRDSTGEEMLRISVSDIIRECKLTNAGYHYDTLKKAALSLMGRQVSFPGLLDDKPYDFHVPIIDKAAAPRFESDDLHFLTRFHPDLLPYILDLKSEFLTIHKQYLNHLGSPYAIKLYMVLKHQSRQNHRFVKYTLPELRFILSIPDDSYKKYGNLKQRLNDWIDEINEFTDITIHAVGETKRKRLVQDVTFEVTHKHTPRLKKDPSLPSLAPAPLFEEPGQDELYDRVRVYQVTRGQFDNWVGLYGRDHVTLAIKIATRYLEIHGKIKKPVAYLDSVMRNQNLVELPEPAPKATVYTPPKTKELPPVNAELSFTPSIEDRRKAWDEKYVQLMTEACNLVLKESQNCYEFFDFIEELKSETSKNMTLGIGIRAFELMQLTPSTLYEGIRDVTGFVYTLKMDYFKRYQTHVWEEIKAEMAAEAQKLGKAFY